MQNKEGVKGQHWFMEEDMKRASGVLRMDKSGKTLLTLLRHLGRLQEVWPSAVWLSCCISLVACQLTALWMNVLPHAHDLPWAVQLRKH